MRHFRLYLVFSLLTVIVSSVLVTLWCTHGRVAQAILAALCGVVAIILLLALVGRLIKTMSVVVRAMEEGHTNIHFPRSDDRALNSMSVCLNRILTLYHGSMEALETRKLYYDRILKVVTHEIRNGITPIISVSKDIQNHPIRYKEEELTEAVGMIYSQSQEIKRFLDSYYELTHLPSPDITKIDLSEFFEEVDKGMKGYLHSSGLSEDVVKYTVPHGLTLEADRGLLRQVIINLIKNALEAVAGREDGAIRIVASISEGVSYISVTDNGPGIDGEGLEMLFQPFYTTKSGGSGIGLCLSRQIARLHGGDLKATSRPGAGATFTLLLNNPG